MGERVGLIAGSGKIPPLIYQELKKSGREVCLAAVKGDADPDGLMASASLVGWFGFEQVNDLIAFFKDHGVSDVLIAGKFDHKRIFLERLDLATAAGAFLPPQKTAAKLVTSAIRFLESNGLSVLDPSRLLKSALCPEGQLTEQALPGWSAPDVAFGLAAAKTLADMDVGQTLVVKQGVVAAVEGLEGTNEAILRGGRLAGKGTVVVKVSRTDQDPRIDWPAVGLETVESCVEAGSAVLCLEAGRVLFFQKDEAVRLAEDSGLCILAKRAGSREPGSSTPVSV